MIRSAFTDYQAKYIAYALTRRFRSDSAGKLATALVDAQVDLNPHQVDAALFAFSSPLSRGALLADEVGLGKTIEAGLVVSQRWAERKRRILVITPSNLRKQWHRELTEKFFLPCGILETRSYNARVKEGNVRPFEAREVVICSYEFARRKADDLRSTPWDLVVIDEAHRLRNVYKPTNITANALKVALAHSHKLLLTATPLQNSLLELYGLVSFIDEYTFGDLQSFKDQFVNGGQETAFEALRARLKPICHRTLRRQVQRENLQALPTGQRSLMTLVLRKLLASSTFAIAGALTTMSNRLKAKLRASSRLASTGEELEEELEKDYETLEATAEEWPEDEIVEMLSEAGRATLKQEIADLEAFTALAISIQQNAKGIALLGALERILHIATNPGDLVLDSFAGSGTTGAVAHRMGRRWIMIELGEHVHTHIVPRLKKVIDGDDPGGITEVVDWKGGGGFRYFRLAPSLLTEDRWGNWIISYVTTVSLIHAQLHQLSDEVGPERTLLVLCASFRARTEEFANLTVKKIPDQVLARCEWGHDDYSLCVQNLPAAPAAADSKAGAEPARPTIPRRRARSGDGATLDAFASPAGGEPPAR